MVAFDGTLLTVSTTRFVTPFLSCWPDTNVKALLYRLVTWSLRFGMSFALIGAKGGHKSRGRDGESNDGLQRYEKTTQEVR
jgi:hypothetical protein